MIDFIDAPCTIRVAMVREILENDASTGSPSLHAACRQLDVFLVGCPMAPTNDQNKPLVKQSQCLVTISFLRPCQSHS